MQTLRKTGLVFSPPSVTLLEKLPGTTSTSEAASPYQCPWRGHLTIVQLLPLLQVVITYAAVGLKSTLGSYFAHKPVGKIQDIKPSLLPTYTVATNAPSLPPLMFVERLKKTLECPEQSRGLPPDG